MPRAFPFLIFALLSWGAMSCSGGGKACAPRDYQKCTCDDGKEGYQQCDDTGSKYGACDCSGTIPGLTTGTGGDTGGTSMGGGGTGGTDTTTGTGGGKAGFLEPCTVNEDCESGVCFNFTSKGNHCTKACTADTDCPPPSGFCNPKGVCKLP